MRKTCSDPSGICPLLAHCCLSNPDTMRANFRNAVYGVLSLAISLLVVAAAIRHVRKSAATAALMQEEYFLVPVEAPQLASFPEAMPGNGHSGRATNEEDYTDPYGGGDVPGPYGRVNDPYDGDWALGPLGGKAMRIQSLRGAVEPAKVDHNLWNSDAMGTNSIFMGNMPASEAYKKMGAVDPHSIRSGPAPANDNNNGLRPDQEGWIGTNTVFFGANGGGLGFAKGKRQGMVRSMQARRPRISAQEHKQAVMKAQLQSLFRSGDPHEAEYGREGENQLDASVLPSEIGSGGPVMGVDGKPSNGAHEWKKHDEPFTFACNPDIYGCESGLTVDPLYAHD